MKLTSQGATLDTRQFAVSVTGVLATVIILTLVLIPIIDTATTGEVIGWTHVDGDSGVPMDYLDLSAAHDDSSVTVTLADGVLTLTGSYSGSVEAQDQIVALSDTSSVFVQNGVLYSYDGSTLTSGDTFTVTVEGSNVNGTPSSWVYIPAEGGIYSSYNAGYESEPTMPAVSVGTFAGVTVQSKGTEVLTENPYGLNVTVDSDEAGVYGVSYGR